MNYLIDTNIIIEHTKDIIQTVNLLRELRAKADLFCSVISITEFRAGLINNIDRDIRWVVNTFIPIEVSVEIAQLAGALMQRNRPKVFGFDFADAIIAATAVENNLVLVTKNRKHFPMKEVKLYPEI